MAAVRIQVKETIMTSALLQLPLSIPKREKQQRVADIINQLVHPPISPSHLALLHVWAGSPVCCD